MRRRPRTRRPPPDAEASAIIVGKTTLPEIGWKGLGDSPVYGITRNPWKTGPRQAVHRPARPQPPRFALGHFHLGTDGLGSIRIPAAFTGVFGLKPSFGRVPAYPLSTMSVLAHLGPLTRRVEDAAIMLSLIGRPDARQHGLEHDLPRLYPGTEHRRPASADRLFAAARLRRLRRSGRGRGGREGGEGVRGTRRDRRGGRSADQRSARDHRCRFGTQARWSL